jgi:hypothetical protein
MIVRLKKYYKKQEDSRIVNELIRGIHNGSNDYEVVGGSAAANYTPKKPCCNTMAVQELLRRMLS